MRLKDTVHIWLRGSLSDPIADILAKNSHLTTIQLETLLIDIFSENLAGKPLKYDEKASMRLTKAKLSRGAFNRTLKQAKENVTKSIYTVLLLGYVGVFDTTTLDPYLEIANKLHQYLEAYKDVATGTEHAADDIKIVEIMRKELEEGLKRLGSTTESTV